MAGHRVVLIVFVLVTVLVPAAHAAPAGTVVNRLWVETAAAVPLYQQLDLYGVARRLDWKARGDERIKGYDMALRDAGVGR